MGETVDLGWVEVEKSCVDVPLVMRLDGNAFVRYWGEISGELDKIEDAWKTWWTKEYLYTEVVANHFQVWVVGVPAEGCFKLVIFTQLINYPAGTALQGFLVFGNGLDEFAPTIDAFFRKLAPKLGCSFIEIIGRRGWGKKLAKFGFVESATVVMRPVQLETEH